MRCSLRSTTGSPAARTTTWQTAGAAASWTAESPASTAPATGGLMAEPWWKTWPGRLEAEEEALRQTGIRYEIDQGALDAGTLRLEAWPIVEGETVHLTVTFPTLYPFFRFDVVAPELELSHHQNAQTGSLCLWGRGTENWDTHQLLASALIERLPKTLAAARATDTTPQLATAEEPQGEPFSDYYPYAPESIVLIDGSWTIDPALSSGRLRLGIDRNHSGKFRGLVLEVQDEEGKTLAQADRRLLMMLPDRFGGRWVRVAAPIRHTKPQPFFEELARSHPFLREPLGGKIGALTVDVIGVLFPEEHAWRRATSDGWVFMVRSANTSGRRREKHDVFSYFARAGRCGPADLSARIPELAPLRSKSVALAGLGGLGGPSALELGRSGVKKLQLLEPDFVDPATTVRWPLGLQAAGYLKTSCIAEAIKDQWPFTEVTTCNNRIGTEMSLTDLEKLEEWVSGADLIYDATAELGVSYYLSELARRLAIPYVGLWTHQGVWAGIIIRIDPETTAGCWVCLRHHMGDGTIPAPVHDRARPIQPRGCADPTFSGSGFDLTFLASVGVRSAVAALTGGNEGAYPTEDWDVLILETRDEQGRSVPPRSQTFKLSRHPECDLCRRR